MGIVHVLVHGRRSLGAAISIFSSKIAGSELVFAQRTEELDPALHCLG